MFWVESILGGYLLGVVITFVITAKFKKFFEDNISPPVLFTLAWPLAILIWAFILLCGTPGAIYEGMGKLHNHLFQWLNAPKTIKPSVQKEIQASLFVGGYRNDAGIKCPACQRNV